MGTLNRLELENEHVAEEMVEHMVLERIGALHDHGHGKGIRLKKKVKRKKRSYNFEFYFIFGLIILGEAWYIIDFVMSKFQF